ncbi:hypothetical protein [Burkholderia pseudomallei]|uniref:hypothetical protein n=1 Tax=Burkholderia pseudomallei TaxID=28450 RepID=UPI0011AB8B41|nr:hypothetical protein [Burkholderia pseudomallei]NRD85011.1 hypothetical protein [Burkholderia pseudomallei]
MIATLWGAEPAPKLTIVRRDAVRKIIAGWPQDAALDWGEAIRKCRNMPRSCFIGVQTDTGVPILALIRVSDAHLHTNLLFLEKDENEVPPGLAMTMVDAVLEVVAAVFGSDRIVLDNPLSGLQAYYEQFGYEPMKRCGRETHAMFKTTSVQ